MLSYLREQLPTKVDWGRRVVKIFIKDAFQEDERGNIERLMEIEQLHSKIRAGTSLDVLGDEIFAATSIKHTLLKVEAAIAVTLDYPKIFTKLLQEIILAGTEQHMRSIQSTDHLVERVHRVIIKEWNINTIVRHKVNEIVNDFKVTGKLSPFDMAKWRDRIKLVEKMDFPIITEIIHTPIKEYHIVDIS